MCGKLAANKQMYTDCNSNNRFWRAVCNVLDFDRADRTIGIFDFETKSKMSWKKHFELWCGLRILDGSQLKTIVNDTLIPDNTGKTAHPVYGPIGSWDVSQVTRMNGLFADRPYFDVDISLWDVSNVVDMRNMFFNASSFDQNIGEWNVKKVKFMENMFNYATKFNQDISSWDMSKVIDITHMFAHASAFNQNLRAWNVNPYANKSVVFVRSGMQPNNFPHGIWV